jgi:uncharacterized protein (DUF2141 family)
MLSRRVPRLAGMGACALAAFHWSATAQVLVAGHTAGQFGAGPSGAATYQIPVRVVPGIAGMEPKLELVYSGQAGHAAAGQGWQLSGLGAVTRCPKTIAQDGARGAVTFAADDRFCLDGQRLVLVAGTWGAPGSEYRTELDGFSRITATGTAGTGPASFVLKSKSGLTMEYGLDAASRVDGPGSTAASWALSRITDPAGNSLTVAYTKLTATRELFPVQIDYGANAAANVPAFAQVRLAYETRPDAAGGYASGMAFGVTQRLTAIRAYAGASLVREYRLSYAGGTLGRSLLSSVQECAGDGSCFKPLSFTYTHAQQIGQPPGLQAASVRTLTTSSLGTDLYHAKPADLNGDGKTDMLAVHEGTSGWYAWVALGNGDGTFRPAQVRTLTTSPLATAGSRYVTQLADLNGDGKMDLVATHQGTDGWHAWVALGNGDGTFVPAVQRTLTTSSLGQPGMYAAYAADIDADGRSDLIATYQGTDGWYAWVALGNGDGSFTTAQVRTLTTSSLGSNLYASQVSDLNGDGKSDLVATHEGTSGWYAWVALGNGDGTFTAAQSRTLTTTALSTGTTAYRAFPLDVNGDGVGDLLASYQGTDGWYAWIALGKGDGSFETAQLRTLTTSSLGMPGTYAQQVGDVNGDGRVDLVATYSGTDGWYAWTALGKADGTFGTATVHTLTSSSLGAPGLYQTQIVDLDGDAKADFAAMYQGTDGWYAWEARRSGESGVPDLLATIDGGNGFLTRLRYGALTDSALYTKDTAAVFPKIDLQPSMYVVVEATAGNGIGGETTTQYSYGGLKAAQGTGRGMLGFRWTKAKNLDTGIESYTELHQDWPFIGMVAKMETRLAGAGNASVLKRSTSSYAQGAGSAAPAVFVYSSQSVEESWDLNGAALPTITTTSQYSQSPQYGDPTQIQVSLSDGTSKTAVNEFWPAQTTGGQWILGRLKKATVTSTKP